MNRLIQYFIDRSFAVNLIAGFICIAGIVTLTSMKRDLIPPFEWQMVQAQISLPGATPEEMEKFVVFPLEESLKGMPGVEKTESKSSTGFTKINLFYSASFDRMTEAAETVRSRIESQRARLPQSIRHIKVERIRVNEVFLFVLALENFDEANTEHRLYIKKFEEKLGQIKGVVRSEVHARARDVYIEFYPKKLSHYNISATQARRAVREALRLTPIGQVKDNESRFSVELAKADSSLEDLKQLPVTANLRGDSVRLGQLAKIHYRLSEQNRLVQYNGKQTVTLQVFKDTNSDTIALKGKVLKVIDEFNSTLPKPLVATVFADGPAFIEKQIEVLNRNGILGLSLVILILMLLLNWRTSIMTVIGLPVAYLGTLVVLHQLGIAIDLISIIGMILVIGILVDDAIIVSERYVENLQQGLPPRKAAYEAARQLIVPVTGTVLTTIVAFAPMILIKSEISTVLFAVPVVIIVSLLLSWLESFFILPNHLAHFVKKAPPKSPNSYFSRFRRGYERILRLALRGRYAVIAVLLIAFGISGYWASKKLKHNFNLNISMERVTVFAILKKSQSLEDSMKQLAPLQDVLLQLPKKDVETVYSRIGNVWIDGRIQEGYRFARFDLYLDKNSAYPSRLKRKIQKKTEKILAPFKDGELYEKLYSKASRQGRDEEKESMVTVQIRGGEEVDFHQIEKAIAAEATQVKGVLEAVDDPDRYRTSWQFVANPQALLQHSLSPTELANQLRGLFVPDELLETRISGEKVFIYTQNLRERPPHFSELSGLRVTSSRGTSVPLHFLGQWREKTSLNRIHHLNGRRELKVDFKIEQDETNTKSIKENIKTSLAKVSTQYPSYEIKVVDTNEEEAKNRAWALKVALLAICAVLVILALILGSLTQPLLVGLPIPFGLIGIIWALYLHNMPLGLMAIIGLVGTVGVSDNDSLIMVDSMNKFAHKTGKALNRESIIEGASSRFRAILLTTITTLGGVFPMAYSFGGESGFTQPLAFSMGWGLSFSTLLTLFILPALMEIRMDVLGLISKVYRWSQRNKPPLPELNPQPAQGLSHPALGDMAQWDWDETGSKQGPGEQPPQQPEV